MNFESVIKENRALILKVCSTFSQDGISVQDLYQEICINIWRGLPTYKGESSLSTWLYRVALNSALSQKKKHLKNPLYQAKELYEISGENNEDQLDDTRALHQAIKQLNPSDKAIIILYLEEMSYEEIAEIIGITIKNVSVKLVRIKRKLEKTVTRLLESGENHE